MKTTKAQKLRYPKPEDKREPRPLTKPATQPNKIQKPLKGGLGSGKPLITASPHSGKVQLFKQLALDTETTGTDLWHGCQPFFVSTCDEDGNLRYWEWDVNPLTREVGHYWGGRLPKGKPGTDAVIRKAGLNPSQLRDSPFGSRSFVAGIPPQDKAELKKLTSDYHFILHNTKFDVRALETIGVPRLNLATCQDTLIASHVLVSNESHKLKDLSLQYLNIRDDDQDALREATKSAREIARGLGWDIAKDGGHKFFPAQRTAPKEGWWVFDTWLPRAIAKYKWEVEEDDEFMPPTEPPYKYPERQLWGPKRTPHPWWTVLSTYALRDAERTYGLWWLQLEALEQEGLMEAYEKRRRLLEPVYEMEHDGAFISRRELSGMEKKLSKEADAYARRCLEIADHKIDNLNSSRQLEGLLFGTFGIRPSKLTKAAIQKGSEHNGQRYAVDAEVLTKLLDRTEGDHREFVWKLLGYRAREKSRDYLEEYCLRGVPAGPGWLTLHSSFNITGTDTVRFSSSGPNLQNVGKGGRRKDDPIPSLRSIFGPAPGREWYSIDYSNIEMRIFAYKSGDPDLIAAFEAGESVHLVFAEMLYEEQWAEMERQALFDNKWVDSLKNKVWRETVKKHRKKIDDPEFRDLIRKEAGARFKQVYESTYYQWCKNGNFALIYGAGEEKADTTYHRPGAYRLIRSRLPKIDQFMKEKDHEAKSVGYVTLDGDGYRLWVPPLEPHVAVNYYVQGDAGWCMVLAIDRVYRYLCVLNDRIRRQGVRMPESKYKMIMTIHDELDFDFPKHERNDQVIREIGKIMADCGQEIGVPTPVEIERHTKSWAEGEKLAL